ncbi:hypothetical protein ACVWW1_001015 [Bradyrhizobium sp. JR3.5]
MDAIVKGTAGGLELLMNIIAMLLVLVALVYLANAIIGLLPEIGGAKISLQRLLGYVMAPVCWLMGLPWPQAITAGSLMGTKTVLNELIAYVDLSKLGPDALDPRSRLIMLYAMCGFANFASLGIMIGGLGIMAPGRRDEINALGLKSIVSGTLTTLPDGRDRGDDDSAVARMKRSAIRGRPTAGTSPGFRCAPSGLQDLTRLVMPGLDPGIHRSAKTLAKLDGWPGQARP